jgi:hypothetical protein
LEELERRQDFRAPGWMFVNLLGGLTCDGERRMREISILLLQNRREGYKNIEMIMMFKAAYFAP